VLIFIPALLDAADNQSRPNEDPVHRLQTVPNRPKKKTLDFATASFAITTLCIWRFDAAINEFIRNLFGNYETIHKAYGKQGNLASFHKKGL